MMNAKPKRKLRRAECPWCKRVIAYFNYPNSGMTLFRIHRHNNELCEGARTALKPGRITPLLAELAKEQI